MDQDPEIKSLAQTYLASRPHAALSIGVVDNETSRFYHFGSVSQKAPRPATSASVYEIGSLTKTFAGLLLAQAITENRVRPDDDIRKHLTGSYPNLEFNGEPIRLLHLANMTSALPDNLPDLSVRKGAGPWEKTRALAAYTREQFFRDLGAIRLTEKPGSSPAHSNTGGQVLGYILERLYRTSFEKQVARAIEKPLGMRAVASSATQGYDEKGDPMPGLTMASARASGGLRYSAEAMVRYLRHQIAEKSDAVVLSHKPNWYTLDKKVALGFFWIIEGPDTPHRRFRYSGGTYGYSSFCDFYPERKRGTVLLSNQADDRAQDDLKKLAEAIAARP